MDTSGNHFPAEVTVYIKDSHGATNTCRQILTVAYPPPRLVLIKVLDQNRYFALGPAGWPANPLQDLQFAHIGGWVVEPFASRGARVQNAGQPTRTLYPAEQRFLIGPYTQSDHNPLRLTLVLEDDNSHRHAEGLGA